VQEGPEAPGLPKRHTSHMRPKTLAFQPDEVLLHRDKVRLRLNRKVKAKAKHPRVKASTVVRDLVGAALVELEP
jgi:hypothetical protein